MPPATKFLEKSKNIFCFLIVQPSIRMASRGTAMQDRDVAYEIDRNIADLTMVSAVLQCSLVSGSWAR